MAQVESPFRIDSVVVAVPRLDQAVGSFGSLLGMQFGSVHRLESTSTETSWAQLGDAAVQLIAPTSESGPIAEFVANRGSGLYAVTLRVPDLRRAASEIEARGGSLGNRGAVIDAGYAQEVVIRPNCTEGALFVLREWTKAG